MGSDARFQENKCCVRNAVYRILYLFVPRTPGLRTRLSLASSLPLPGTFRTYADSIALTVRHNVYLNPITFIIVTCGLFLAFASLRTRLARVFSMQ